MFCTLFLAICLGLLVSCVQAQLLITSFYDNDILSFNQNTGAFQGKFVSSGSGLQYPRELVFGPDGDLYVSSGTVGVIRYNGKTGAFIDNFVPVGSGGLSTIPLGLTFGPDGDLYVGDYGHQDILRYNGTTGAPLGTFVTSGSGDLARPYALTFRPDGNLYVLDGGNLSYGDGVSGVKVYSGTTGAFLSDFVSNTSGGLNVPTDMKWGPDGNLYVCSEVGGQILRYNGTTGAFMDVFASGNGLFEPQGLSFGPGGDLYVLNDNSSGSSSVLRFNGTTGAFLSDFIPTVPDVQDGSPYSLTFAPQPKNTVPEPGALALLGTGMLCALPLLRRRR
jgi:DNA-binding beta-propeller fold protein YncE